jgi:hypothetical protein
MNNKDVIENRKEQLIRLTSEFCEAKLDEEHKELSRKLIQNLFNQTSRPFKSANVNQWAAGILYSIGTANLLFDDSFEPYISVKELNEYFEADPDMTFRNASFINEQLNLDIFDGGLSLLRKGKSNPLENKISVDGIYLPMDVFSSKIQERIKNIQSQGYMVEFRSTE